MASLPDLDLASLFFDQAILLQDGHIAADGPVAEVLVPARIEAAYGARTMVRPHPTTGAPHVIVLPDGAVADGEKRSP